MSLQNHSEYMQTRLKDFTEPEDTEILIAPRNKTTKRIFIAATRMNDGKTTTSLALFSAIRSITDRVGFIKPVGQRFVEVEGRQIDEGDVGPPPPAPHGDNEDNSDWQGEVLTKAPVHHLGYFLDRFDFAAL